MDAFLKSDDESSDTPDENTFTSWLQQQPGIDTATSFSSLFEKWQAEYSSDHGNRLTDFLELTREHLRQISIDELRPKIDAWSSHYLLAVISQEIRPITAITRISALRSFFDYARENAFLSPEVAGAADDILAGWKHRTLLFIPPDILARPDANFIKNWSETTLQVVHRSALDSYLPFAPDDLTLANIEEIQTSIETWIRDNVLTLVNSGKIKREPTALIRLDALKSFFAYGRKNEYLSPEIAGAIDESLSVWREKVKGVRPLVPFIAERSDADFLETWDRENTNSAYARELRSFLQEVPGNIMTLSPDELREAAARWGKGLCSAMVRGDFKATTAAKHMRAIRSLLTFGKNQKRLSPEAIDAASEALKPWQKYLDDQILLERTDDPWVEIFKGRPDEKLLTEWRSDRLARSGSFTLQSLTQMLQYFLKFAPTDLTAINSENIDHLRKSIYKWNSQLLDEVVSNTISAQTARARSGTIKSLFTYALENRILPREITGGIKSAFKEGKTRVLEHAAIQGELPLFLTTRSDRQFLEQWIGTRDIHNKIDRLEKYLRLAPDDLTSASRDEIYNSIAHYDENASAGKIARTSTTRRGLQNVASLLLYGFENGYISKDVADAARGAIDERMTALRHKQAENIPSLISNRSDKHFLTAFYERLCISDNQNYIRTLVDFLSFAPPNLADAKGEDIRKSVVAWTENLLDRVASTDSTPGVARTRIGAIKRLFKEGAKQHVFSPGVARMAKTILTAAADHTNLHMSKKEVPLSILERPDSDLVKSWYKDHAKNEKDIRALYDFLEVAPKDIASVSAPELRGCLDRWTVRLGTRVKSGTMTIDAATHSLNAIATFFDGTWGSLSSDIADVARIAIGAGEKALSAMRNQLARGSSHLPPIKLSPR